VTLFPQVKFCVTAVLVSVLAFPSISKLSASTSSSDSVKSVVRLLEEHYHGARTLQAVFLERYSEGPHGARIESGRVYFQRPGRMRWEYESPEKKLFVSDGKMVWFYVPADRTVTRVPVKESTDWREPLALLTGKADLGRLCSRIEIDNQAVGLAGHVTLRCEPKGTPQNASDSSPDVSKDKDLSKVGRSASGSAGALSGGDFTEVLLEVDSSSGELARVEVRQPGGIELEYRFGDWKENLPLSEDIFHFHPPAGVAIVDGKSPSSSP
jgi:outer membrane lipoprotein carrier protein